MSMNPWIATIMKISGVMADRIIFRVIVYTCIIAGLVLIFLTHPQGHVTFIYNQF